MSQAGADEARLAADLRVALRRWHSPALGGMALATYLVSVERRLAAEPQLSRAEAVQDAIRAALQQLRASGGSEQAELLEQHFIRSTSVYRLCLDYHLSERSVYYRLKAAVAALSEALKCVEQAAIAAEVPELGPTPAIPADDLVQNLPPPSYARLFGVENVVAQTLEHLRDPDAHWLICVEGLGGLGKTAVAREAVGRAASSGNFVGIAWLTAKREFFTWRRLEESALPALTFEEVLDGIGDQLSDVNWGPLPLATKKARARALLQAQPYLVILDNLETAADCAALPGQIWELANPSKFLLTSRHHVVPSSTACPAVLTIQLGELSEAASLALLRYEGQVRGLRQVADADDCELLPILGITGGHPLALKLVAGQLASLPPDRILARLQRGGHRADPFYRFLYWPSWELLSDSARRLLRAMALLPVSGGTWQDLEGASGLEERSLGAAVEELVDHSLLQAGGLAKKAYLIHRLTHHFVLGQVMPFDLLADGALRIGAYYLEYAREHRDDWAALGCRQEHVLEAMQLCAALLEESDCVGQKEVALAARRILVEFALVFGPYMLRRSSTAAWQPHLKAAIEAATHLEDRRDVARLQNQMGQFRTRLAERDVALTLHRQAAETFRKVGDNLNVARSLRFEGNIHYARDELEPALACYEDARQLLADLDQPRELSHIYNNIASVHLKLQNWDEALQHFEQAVAILDPERDERYIRVWRNNMGLLRFQRGEWRRAVRELLDILPLHRQAGDRASLANCHHYLLLAYADLEIWDEALFHGRQALALRQALGGGEGLADLGTELAKVYSRLGDCETAAAFLDEALSLWQSVGDAAGLAHAWLVRGDLCSHAGRWLKAQSAYLEVLSLLGRTSGPQPHRLFAMLGLVRACQHAGSAAEARAWLSRLEAAVGQTGTPEFEVHLLWLRAEMNPPCARETLEEALALCNVVDNDRFAWLRSQTEARLAALSEQQRLGGGATTPAREGSSGG